MGHVTGLCLQSLWMGHERRDRHPHLCTVRVWDMGHWQDIQPPIALMCEMYWLVGHGTCDRTMLAVSVDGTRETWQAPSPMCCMSAGHETVWQEAAYSHLQYCCVRCLGRPMTNLKPQNPVYGQARNYWDSSIATGGVWTIDFTYELTIWGQNVLKCWKIYKSRKSQVMTNY